MQALYYNILVYFVRRQFKRKKLLRCEILLAACSTSALIAQRSQGYKAGFKYRPATTPRPQLKQLNSLVEDKVAG